MMRRLVATYLLMAVLDAVPAAQAQELVTVVSARSPVTALNAG